MCFFPEKYIREFPGSNGLLRPENQSYRKSHWSPFCCSWRRTSLEGTDQLHVLQNIYDLNLFHPESWNLFPTSLCRKKDVYAWAVTVAPLRPHRALPQAWVCLRSRHGQLGGKVAFRYTHWGARVKVHVIRLWSFQTNLVLPHVISSAIHRSQPWFHHKISREEAQRLIIQQGLVDG